MSDSDLELEYEQRLQAEPRLLLHVDGRLRRVEPNTAEGRQAIDKAALRYSETSDNVTVNREGAGGADSSASGRGEGVLRGSSTAPASSRSTGCCLPSVYAGPSGRRMRHAWNCPEASGQVLVSVAVPREPFNLARRLQAETLRVGLDDAIQRHPAGGTLTATTERCPVHDSEGAWDCVICSDRRVG